MEIRGDTVIIEKEPSGLDELVLNVTETLEDLKITYSVVSGYIAVLFGRSRATEDIDVITEPFSEATATELSARLRDAGYWGSAMPLDSMYEMLNDESIIRIAEDGHRVPNVELKFAGDKYDRASLANTITVRLNDRELRVGELELQIAYKLYLGSQKDFEDALYLHRLSEPTLNSLKLEEYAEELDVTEEYEQLTRT
ncbi:hypothetical protein [Halorussus halophilus]|uniref:hypothetical protein n=1 Tax=Halorussus halophilus TaxID=2650975 RepID=UPI0013015D6A|nr:hypothetical protein [Halorussus halophilus]